jgi:hypothetical protein
MNLMSGSDPKRKRMPERGSPYPKPCLDGDQYVSPTVDFHF